MTASSELPALLGGAAAFPDGPPSWPASDPAIGDALAAAFRDGSWGKYHAHHTTALAAELQATHGVEHVLLCGSGTYAVELGLRALGVEPGDEVILAGYDYPGNFLAIHAVGALPVLVDIDAGNWNLSPAALQDAIGPKSRVILASHLHGGSVPMHEVMAFARAHGVQVLEDAAQAPGRRIQGDVGVLSFGGSKLLTAGRGGALLTNDAAVAQRARTHSLRGNVVCPLSELQAAVLLPQLLALDERNRRRRANARQLCDALADVPGLRPFSFVEGAAFYKLGFQLDAERFGLSRAKLVAAMRAEGIALDEGFAAAHVGRSPRRYRRGSALDEVERAHHGCVILHHPILLGMNADMDRVANAWRKVHRHAHAIQAPG